MISREEFDEIVGNEMPQDAKPGATQFSNKVTEITEALIFSYLCNIMKQNIPNPVVNIIHSSAIANLEVPYITKVLPILDVGKEIFIPQDPLGLFSINFRGEEYGISLFRFTERICKPYIVIRNIYIAGQTSGACEPGYLYKCLLNEAIQYSSFRKKIVKYEKADECFIENIKVIHPAKSLLNNIFLSETKKDQILRFIHALKNFNKDRICLRYLLNGQPGTGKTEIIRAIISETEGLATVLLTNGSDLFFNGLNDKIEFLKLFEVSLLIIDDLDFAVRDRNAGYDSKDNAEFLQFLDGVVSNNIFVLATTNDKKLVDVAASRPGRFDLIMDIGEINYENYLDLILRETNDEEIIDFFNDDFLLQLKARKVSGAYIVSLIKQLKSIKKMRGRLEEPDFFNYFNLSHKGFYSSNLENKGNGVGFEK